MRRHPPPVWLFLLAVVLVYGGAAVAAVRLLHLPDSFAAPLWLSAAVGGTFVVVGLALLGWAVRHLSWRRAFGLEIYAPAAESVLVTTGPYALVRNPLYLGASTALVGWTLVLRSLVLAIATTMMLVHFVLVAKWEERELRARLGEPYEAYRRATPLFVPRLLRRHLGD